MEKKKLKHPNIYALTIFPHLFFFSHAKKILKSTNMDVFLLYHERDCTFNVFFPHPYLPRSLSDFFNPLQCGSCRVQLATLSGGGRREEERVLLLRPRFDERQTSKRGGGGGGGGGRSDNRLGREERRKEGGSQSTAAEEGRGERERERRETERPDLAKKREKMRILKPSCASSCDCLRHAQTSPILKNICA